MAKTTSPKSSESSTPAKIEHTVALERPEALPALLDDLTAKGWTLIQIVACRTTNEHAAYFRRG
jgi:hypothetical protein